MNKKIKNLEKERESVATRIRDLIANPPMYKKKTEPDDFMKKSNIIGSAALMKIRELACRQTGLTMQQLLEAESMVSHPREVIPVEVSHRQVARRRMKQAGVPELFIRSVADNGPIHCQPLEVVKDFLQGHNGFLLLSGGKGNRKTGSSCWALGQVEKGIFLDAGELVELSVKESEQWKKALSSDIVVLDDLGAERRRTDGEVTMFQDAFFRLFNGVYSNCKRMIITCNLTKERFSSEPNNGGYGIRIYDRLREMGRWAEIVGESVRGQ